MKKIVVLSGAGISAESGLKTFRDSDGLWENHRVEDVATPQAWNRDPELVLKFYNERRQQVNSAMPNKAHAALYDLEKMFDVIIVTQNVDDLHERAGSSKVLHLHGELNKARSCGDPNLVYDLVDWEMKIGQTCEKGHQLRPHIVWFGESVPMINEAIPIFQDADIAIVIGTSLSVYPASGLIDYLPSYADRYYIDPKGNENMNSNNFNIITLEAEAGVSQIVQQLMTDQT
tara:strand:+ start:246 stop:938 length:693 start_codon:yes stop_codon:yes gene_type:complete